MVDPRFLCVLAQPASDWGGLGATRLSYDSRDFSMSLLPGVREVREAGLPASVDMSADFRQIMNQGSEPSCVAFSTCGLTSAFDWLADQGWDQLDGHRLYRLAGGDGSNGVDSRTTLELVRNQGAPLLSGAGSLKIGSYVFASREPEQFRRDVAAALAAGHFCTVALLLPSNFSFSSSGSITNGYHQVVACGYTGLGDNDWVILINSWGEQWGQRGVGRVTWGYLLQNSLQSGYVFSFAVTPLVLPKPNPPPPPPPPPPPARAATVRGRAQAGATNGVWPVVGDQVPFGAGVTLTVQEIAFDGEPTPEPLPEPLPSPGGLNVTLEIIYSPKIRGYLAGVKVTGPETVPAHLIWSPSLPLPADALVNGIEVWGRLGNLTTGTQITVTATQGERTGTATGVVP